MSHRFAGSLLPGALVNVRVKAVLSDGLLVSFLTYFTGTVDPFHLGQVAFAVRRHSSCAFQQSSHGRWSPSPITSATLDYLRPWVDLVHTESQMLELLTMGQRL